MLSSVRATVRSVARWTWTRYQGSTRCCRGAMSLDKSLPLAERQSLAAKRTHELRHRSTESKIRAACRGLQERGEKLTQVAIAILAGVSRQTVANYGHVLNEVTRPQTISFLAPSVSKTFSPGSTGNQGSTPSHGIALTSTLTDVTYGVHQVTAPPGALLILSLRALRVRILHSAGECCTYGLVHAYSHCYCAVRSSIGL
nr:hypothetical protein pPsy0462c_00055 [Pseudomonas syringae]